jgi:hypothetical protein
LYIAPKSPDVTLPLLPTDNNQYYNSQGVESNYDSDNNTIIISSDNESIQENTTMESNVDKSQAGHDLNRSGSQTSYQPSEFFPHSNGQTQVSSSTIHQSSEHYDGQTSASSSIQQPSESLPQHNSHTQPFFSTIQRSSESLSHQDSQTPASLTIQPPFESLLLHHESQTQASSSTIHQPPETLPYNDDQFSFDSNVNNILNTREFRTQHLNSLKITYGISNHETIRIVINDRSSITDYLLNWIYSAEA